MEGMIKYECPNPTCDYTMAAKLVVGGPKCPECGTKLEKVAAG